MINKELSDSGRKFIISGIPRTGSTWLAQALTERAGAKYIHEPDNEKRNLVIYALKKGLHRFPYLRVDQNNESFEYLWNLSLSGIDVGNMFFDKVLGGSKKILERKIRLKCGIDGQNILENNKTSTAGKVKRLVTEGQEKLAEGLVKSDLMKKLQRRPGDTIVVKSVHNMLALKWLEHRFEVDFIVIVRHPANVIASYNRLDLPDAFRYLGSQNSLVQDYLEPFIDRIREADTDISKMALQVGAFYYVLESYLESSSSVLVRHEDLCEDPLAEFKTLFDKLELSWSDKVRKFLQAHDREGEGYEIHRKAREQINKYRRELTNPQIKEIKKNYEIYGNELYSRDWVT